MKEEELIQALIQKDETAFKWLVEAYRNKVYNTVLNILQDSADADDATQEVFIQVYASVSSFKQQSTLSTWIYRIAVRKALDKLRKRKTRRRLQQWLPWWMPEEKKSEEKNFYHPGIALDNKEKAAVLFKAVNSLPERQRVAFTLIKIQGMNYNEACSTMQENLKTIESLVSRAKQNLQRTLENKI